MSALCVGHFEQTVQEAAEDLGEAVQTVLDARAGARQMRQTGSQLPLLRAPEGGKTTGPGLNAELFGLFLHSSYNLFVQLKSLSLSELAAWLLNK